MKTGCENRKLFLRGLKGIGSSEKDFIDAMSSPEGQKLRTVFLDDEAKFLDFANSAAFFTEEHVLVGGNG